MNRATLTLILLAALAACSGGGGGGGNVIPSTPAPHNTPSSTHKLSLGFKQTSGSTTVSSAHRWHILSQASLAQYPLVGDFIIGDSWLSSLPDITMTYNAIAYYNLSNGALPSPVPTVTWSQTGNPVPTASPIGNDPNVQTDGIVGSVPVMQPTTIGQSTIAATASDGEVVSSYVNTYPANGLAAPGVSSAFATCLSFATGTAEPAQGNCDISISNPPNTNGLTISMPYGGQEIIGNQTIDQVTVADLTTPVATVTDPNFGMGGGIALVFKTAGGAYVKWSVWLVMFAGTTPENPTTQFYGPYMVSSGGQFPY